MDFCKYLFSIFFYFDPFWFDFGVHLGFHWDPKLLSNVSKLKSRVAVKRSGTSWAMLGSFWGAFWATQPGSRDSQQLMKPFEKAVFLRFRGG